VAKGGKPATTIVKTGTTKVTPTSVKPAAVGAGGGVAPVASSVIYEEEQSTGLTTGLAAGLSVLTWGSFGWLLASYMGWM